MLLKLTKREVLELHLTISNLNGSYHPKFTYALVKIRNALKTEVEAIQTAMPPLPEFKEYEDARQVLCQTMAKKDVKGKPVIHDNVYDIEDSDEFERQLASLRTKYADAIQAQEDHVERLNELLNEETEVEIATKIPFEHLPDTVSVQLMHVLDPFLES